VGSAHTRQTIGRPAWLPLRRALGGDGQGVVVGGGVRGERIVALRHKRNRKGKERRKKSEKKEFLASVREEGSRKRSPGGKKQGERGQVCGKSKKMGSTQVIRGEPRTQRRHNFTPKETRMASAASRRKKKTMSTKGRRMGRLRRKEGNRA